MKVSIDRKHKKYEVDADVEKIVEKGMDLHEKDWKDKFNTKYEAKKELMELKHKQKMEQEEQNKTKKNFIEKILDKKKELKELEIEEQKRLEEEKKKKNKLKIIFSIILGVIGLTLFIVGEILGSKSGDPDSGFYAMGVIGLFPLIAIPVIWLAGTEDIKKKRRK